LFVLKNFRKLNDRGIDQVFSQIRSDHVDKNLLHSQCAPEDIIYFGALILKVKLQSKILRSKQNKISSDLILKSIDYAIPNCFIEDEVERKGGQARSAEHWAQKIEDGYFRRKKFLSGIGLYSLTFSSYFVVQKGASDRREADKHSLMNRLAASKMVKQNTLSNRQADNSDDESNSFTSDDSESQNTKQQFTIDEADTSDENSGSDDDSSNKKKRSQKKPPMSPGKLKRQSTVSAGNLWNQT
jgi:hypothetical protein